MTLSFTVLGTPQPQGSAKGFVYRDKTTGKHRAAITSANPKLGSWRQDVAWAAKEAMGGREPTRDAVAIVAHFLFQKPASTRKRILLKTTKPDIDKCLRSLLDALTGIVFVDDAQVVASECHKLFTSTMQSPGAQITISTSPITEVFDAQS